MYKTITLVTGMLGDVTGMLGDLGEQSPSNSEEQLRALARISHGGSAAVPVWGG
jgi:hypothetical protein